MEALNFGGNFENKTIWKNMDSIFFFKWLVQTQSHVKLMLSMQIPQFDQLLSQIL